MMNSCIIGSVKSVSEQDFVDLVMGIQKENMVLSKVHSISLHNANIGRDGVCRLCRSGSVAVPECVVLESINKEG